MLRWFDYTGSPCLTNSNWDRQLHAKQHSHKKAMSHDCTDLLMAVTAVVANPPYC